MPSPLDATTIKPRESAPGGRWPVSIGLTIVHHPVPARAGEFAALFDLDREQEQALSRSEPVFRSPDGPLNGPLATSLMSRSPLRLSSSHEAAVQIAAPPPGVDLAIDGMAAHGPVTLEPERVRAGVVLELGGCVLLLHRLELVPRSSGHGLLGNSAAMHRMRDEIARVADLDVAVLLRGETGVGKELAAAAIHRASARRDRPFVCVNASALPEATAASELFGHARGAFTGADAARAGIFEQADGGTLFLDEVGDLPENLQAMLLRVLESGELQRVGGGGKRVDVRVVSATDADLERNVASGAFREPLLQRLAGYELRIPPLRERREDIAPLFLHFLRAELAALGEDEKLAPAAAGERGWLRPAFMAQLIRHDFPGNVRELRNLARRVAIANRGRDRFAIDEGVERMLERGRTASDSESPEPAAERRRRPAEIEDDELLGVLREHAFNINRTAEALGMSRTWLNARIDRCASIRKAKDLDADVIRGAARDHAGDVDAMAAVLEVSPRGLLLQMKRLGLR